MGAIGGLLGTSGGASGTGFGGPTSANIQQGVDTGQIGTAYGQNQNALASQQALLNALNQQNGIANQSQVYSQLQGVANGTGPNPAQAALNQNTGTNVANQAALMAGQRGAGTNVGLMARQIAQQGAATQQNAVGQAATLQANQSLNAINSAGGIANTQAANQIGATATNTQAQQNEQQQLLSALGNYNNANVSQQSNINNVNAGLAGNVMSGQQNLIGGGINGIGAAIGAARGGMVKGYDDGGDVTPIVVQPTPNLNNSKSGSNSMAAMLPMLAMAMADGGQASLGVNTTLNAGTVAAPTASSVSGPQSSFGQFLKGWSSGTKGANSTSAATTNGTPSNAPALQQGGASLTSGIINAFKSPSGQAVTMPDGSVASNSNNYGAATLSQPDIGSSFNAAPSAPSLGADLNFAQGGQTHDYRSGGNVKAKSAKEKAVVQGNSYSNDKIPAVLSEGEVVIPRSVMQSKDPVRGSADFVQKVLAKRKGKR